ncbi:hypothetical protein LEP3755_38810 [Leptolyngbya sp. NIES-3755]|nr:hypothetical protein LEP3755_38810 [Leptolyngbya sp. NIES-3755]
MATLQIENLPDDLYYRIESVAIAHDFTLDQAVIYVLRQAFQSDNSGMLQEQQEKSMSEILQNIRNRPRINPVDYGLPDSTDLIREDRDR